VSDNKSDIRSFYETGQSLIMERSSERSISATVQDGRFVSTDGLSEVGCHLSNAAVGPQQ
jgi:hypothetical protein